MFSSSIYVGKTTSYISVQLGKSWIAKMFGCKRGLKVLGQRFLSRGFGWYRMYGNVKAQGRDLKGLLAYIRKTFAEVKEKEASDITIETCKTWGVTPKGAVKYVVHHSGQVHKAVSRAVSACIGKVAEMRDYFVYGAKPTATEVKEGTLTLKRIKVRPDVAQKYRLEQLATLLNAKYHHA